MHAEKTEQGGERKKEQIGMHSRESTSDHGGGGGDTYAEWFSASRPVSAI